MSEHAWLAYIVALTAIAIAALIVVAVVGVNSEVKTGGVALAASCVTAIALLARGRNGKT